MLGKVASKLELLLARSKTTIAGQLRPALARGGVAAAATLGGVGASVVERLSPRCWRIIAVSIARIVGLLDRVKVALAARGLPWLGRIGAALATKLRPTPRRRVWFPGDVTNEHWEDIPHAGPGLRRALPPPVPLEARRPSAPRAAVIDEEPDWQRVLAEVVGKLERPPVVEAPVVEAPVVVEAPPVPAQAPVALEAAAAAEPAVAPVVEAPVVVEAPPVPAQARVALESAVVAEPSPPSPPPGPARPSPGEELAWQESMMRAKAQALEPRTEDREWRSLTTAAKLQALADRASQERAAEDEWARSARKVRNRAARPDAGAAGGARRG